MSFSICPNAGRNPGKPIEAGMKMLVADTKPRCVQGAAIISFDVAPARLYAGIRKDRTIRPPDAIQLACAAQARVDLSFTKTSG